MRILINLMEASGAFLGVVSGIATQPIENVINMIDTGTPLIVYNLYSGNMISFGFETISQLPLTSTLLHNVFALMGNYASIFGLNSNTPMVFPMLITIFSLGVVWGIVKFILNLIR